MILYTTWAGGGEAYFHANGGVILGGESVTVIPGVESTREDRQLRQRFPLSTYIDVYLLTDEGTVLRRIKERGAVCRRGVPNIPGRSLDN